MRDFVRNACTGALLLLAAALAHAASYELRVYGDELTAEGEWEAETVFSMARPRSGTGLRGHVKQFLGEMNYGVAPNWEVGIELPAVHSAQRRGLEGLALEAQYVAPHDEAGGWFWGARAELGRIRSVYEDDAELALELNPILGWRRGRFSAYFNPSLERPLGGHDQALRLHPAARVAMRLSGQDELGVEFFGDWGPVKKLRPAALRDETLYLVWDRRSSFGRFNVGLGQALRPGSGSADKWVAKLGLQFEVD